ncbi:hypothetical protein BD289DRAFT_341064, partial [Coniella lustricola]
LVGKKIDEYGDVVDDDGSVLGRVEGDLPSMVGRSITNARGDVLGDDGELLGYVAAVGTGEDGQANPGGLRVDPFGNILDAEGNNVGSFHDNLSGFGKKAARYAQDGQANKADTSTHSQSQGGSRALSPSDIFMDVKSTTEGIQLTIRIPTVF